MADSEQRPGTALEEVIQLETGLLGWATWTTNSARWDALPMVLISKLSTEASTSASVR